MAVSAATLAIDLTAQGEDRVIGAIGRVSAGGDAVAERFSRATLRLSEFGERMAGTGQVAEASLGRVVGLIGEMAGGFGVTGPLIGALGVAALAITKLFTGARDEMDKTQQKIRETADAALNAGDYASLSKQARDILYGTVAPPEEHRGFLKKFWASIAGHHPEDMQIGLAALEQQRAALEAQLEQGNVATYLTIKQKIDELDARIRPLREAYDAVVTRLQTPDLRPQAGGMPTITVTGGQEARAAEQAAQAIAKEVDLLGQAVKLHAFSAQDIQEITRLQASLTAELNRGNVSEQRKLEIETELAKLAETHQALWGRLTAPTVTPVNLGPLQRAPKVPVQMAPYIDPGDAQRATVELMQAMEQMAPRIASEAQHTLGDAITNGFTAAFRGDKGGLLKGFGDTILQGLGRIFTEMGTTLIGFGKIMAALQKFLANPLTAGPAAIAAGIALVALGAALGAIAQGTGTATGHFGVGSAAATGPQVTNITLTNGQAARVAQGLAPVPPMNVTVIGPNDPAAQRAVHDLMRNAARRGLG